MTGSLLRTVMLIIDVTVPPELVPFIRYIVLPSNSVGIPLIVPLEVSKTRPAGRVGSIVQERISPEPTTITSNGRSLLAVLLIIVKTLVEYIIIGISSLIVILR